MKNLYQNQKGITLIALIITIIVLLILAGVTIAAITGNESAPQKAVEAKDANDIGAMRDEIALIVSTRKISTNTFKQDLVAQYGANAIEEIGDEGYELTHVFYVTKNGKSYTVFENGDVEAGKVDVWDGRSSTEPTNKTTQEIHITTCGELRWLAEQTNLNEAGTTFSGYTVYLDNDLDFGARGINGNWEVTANEQIKWTPIGIANNANQKFEGTFDGQNHTIKGIYVNQTGNYGGIFGNSYSISNLTIKDSYIKAGSYSGGIVGILRSGEIENCHNINTNVTSTSNTVGGIVGQFSKNCTEIINCSNSGNVKSFTENNASAVGGIVGGVMSSNGVISRCYNIGNVYGQGYNVGGICGQFGQTGRSNSMSYCYNTGTVEGLHANVGGIAGFLSGDASMQYVYNKGTVISDYINHGSIIGSTASTGTITKSYYLNTLDFAAIGGETESTDDLTNNVKGTSYDIKTYEEFLEKIDDDEFLAQINAE